MQLILTKTEERFNSFLIHLIGIILFLEKKKKRNDVLPFFDPL